MGVVAAPTESPPAHARTARGICGTTPANPYHGRVPDPIRSRAPTAPSRWHLAIARESSVGVSRPLASLALTSRDRHERFGFEYFTGARTADRSSPRDACVCGEPSLAGDRARTCAGCGRARV